MVIWFMMKPMMHLCIKDLDPLKLIFTKRNVIWLKLIFRFKNISRHWHIELPQSFNIRMLIKSWPWAFHSGFLIIWRMSFLEKWQLANTFSVTKVNCDGNTLLSAKKDLRFHHLLKISNKPVRKLCSCKLNIVRITFKSKESPRMAFEHMNRYSQPEFTYQDLQIKMIMKMK